MKHDSTGEQLGSDRGANTGIKYQGVNMKREALSKKLLAINEK